jgi:hypothetical protein
MNQTLSNILRSLKPGAYVAVPVKGNRKLASMQAQIIVTFKGVNKTKGLQIITHQNSTMNCVEVWCVSVTRSGKTMTSRGSKYVGVRYKR